MTSLGKFSRLSAAIQDDDDNASNASQDDETESESDHSVNNNKRKISELTVGKSLQSMASSATTDAKKASLGQPKKRIKFSLKNFNRSLPTSAVSNGTAKSDGNKINGSSSAAPSLSTSTTGSSKSAEQGTKRDVSTKADAPIANKSSKSSSTTAPEKSEKSKNSLDHKKLPNGTTPVKKKKKKSLDASNVLRRAVKLPMKSSGGTMQAQSPVTSVTADESNSVCVKKAESVTSGTMPKALNTQTKTKRPTSTGRIAKLPALSSPGLMIAPPPGFEAPVGQTLISPAQIFDTALTSLNYTRNHRGSSTRRQVDDLFDSNVKLALHFPGPLIPANLWRGTKDGEDVTLSTKLLKSLEKTVKHGESDGAVAGKKRKRQNRLSFADMAPKSLTIPYPEKYLERHAEYVKSVQKREKSIIAAQQAELLALRDPPSDPSQWKNPVTVPPIPEEPEPPKLSEVYENVDIYAVDDHPIYLPKNGYGSHLDKNCFHITKGRYFGLTTNQLFDYNYYGASAPGLSNAVSGLASVSIGGNGPITTQVPIEELLAGQKAASTAKSLPTVSKGTNASTVVADTTVNEKAKSSKSEKSSKSGTSSAKGSSISTNGKSSSTKKSGSVPHGSLEANATLSQLRKLMESDTFDVKDEMRDLIRRAAVRAGRLAQPNEAFLGADGKIYPEISKAFSAHSGVKPCAKCKSNKQGAFHCRMRRKHRDRDFEGVDSCSLLEPLFNLPTDDLLDSSATPIVSKGSKAKEKPAAVKETAKTDIKTAPVIESEVQDATVEEEYDFK